MLLLLFASLHARCERVGLHARSERPGRRFPLHEWLVFQEIAPQAARPDGRQAEGLRPAARRFFADEAEGVAWEHIAASLQLLVKLGWEDHPGVREWRAIGLRAKGKPEEVGDFPETLKNLWYQTESRIRQGKEWCFKVARFEWSCPVPACPANSVLDPQKRVLWDLRPTICRTCGAVLIPECLAAYLEAKHERFP